MKEDDALGLVGELAGPETHRMVALVKARLRADGRRSPVLRVPVGTRGFRPGHDLVADAPRGRITWG